MQNLDLLADSLCYIESHLTAPLRTEEIAAACACSKSALDKLFRNVCNLSVHDYIIRRRMTRAAGLLRSNPEMTVLDIALECGYSSHEAFTRTFRSVWHRNPSQMRDIPMPELYPRLMPAPCEGDDYIMTRKPFDITELYDLFRSRENCWFVCCDICKLIPINEISSQAGDLAILTAMQRMQDAAGENDIVFRIGGDEFCMLTDSPDEAYADAVMAKIAAHNGQIFQWRDREIPLSLYITKTKASLHTPRYDALFTDLHNAIRDIH